MGIEYQQIESENQIPKRNAFRSFLKTVLRISLLLVSLLVISIFFYERYVLTKWYDFKIANYEIEVMSDECNTCFLDWEFNHTIKIKESNSGKKSMFEFYSEGPRLEFGLNDSKDKLVINCPFFSSKFLDVKKMEEIGFTYDGGGDLSKINQFSIEWEITNDKKLIHHNPAKRPSGP